MYLPKESELHNAEFAGELFRNSSSICGDVIIRRVPNKCNPPLIFFTLEYELNRDFFSKINIANVSFDIE